MLPWALLASVFLSGCSNLSITSPLGEAPVAVDRDGPPLREMDVSNKAEPTPKAEPRIRRGNVSPYRVFGIEYQVMPTAQGYSEIGTSSWYGRKFHGRLTSSGEPFDMFEFTAAHKSLPIPSYVRVTNLANGETLVVRVNDRGPFVENRIIDLSWAAARRLGFDHLGTARVQLDILAHPDMVSPSDANTQATLPGNPNSVDQNPAPMIRLQLASLTDLGAAQRQLSEILDKVGLPASQGRIESVTIESGSVHRVQIGPFSRAIAQGFLSQLGNPVAIAIEVKN